jgi:ribonuclease D
MSDLYIDTPQALEELCATLRDCRWLALDTEFMREKSYYPQLCLIQVASDETVACIDPLAIDDLAPLFELIYDPGITKVLHAARQDLEIFFALRGAIPQPLFDTQIAATVLGHGDQVSYGALVKETLGVELDKSHARTDWAARPLEPAQVRYAADDVRYLRQVYIQQLEELERRGRLDWLAEDFAALAEPDLYTVHPEQAWQRVKGTNRLKGVQLAVVQALAAWREEEAQRSDRPRRWVLRDEVLVDLARHMPADSARLARIRGLENGVVRRHGEELLRLIEAARKTPKDAWPTAERRLRLRPEQDALVDALMAIVRMQGQAAAVSPASLTNRRDLEAIVAGERDAALLHGWRAAIAGRQVIAFLEGSQTLAVRQGELLLQESPD